ncbi:MAG TPA: M1 family metallopeptidase [Kofleriaceae bacterium]|nr:M1 family metallopeptidase [Kofleriaceae bacterium]
MTLARTSLIIAAAAALALACGSQTGAGPDPIAAGSTDQTPPPAVAEGPTPTPPELRLPDTAAPLLYMVELGLDPAADTFTGTARINFRITAASDHLWLHGTELTVASAVLKSESETLEATPLSTSNEHFLGFGFPRAVEAGDYWLEVSYTGKTTDNDYSGLFRQEEDGAWYLYSQFEAFSARRAFPSFDEPKFKVPFALTLHVPEALQAFSNTPAKLETKGPTAGWKTITFETTKPLPSYLVALAVGPFEIVDVGAAGRNKTPVRIITTKGHTAQAAYAKRAVVELQDLLEAYFDMAYPYAKLDHIVVPRFLGAMENPGLITYDGGILLAEPGKESRGWQRRSANVIAHELAHQWFGNLVTLGWWDDIWLNESFATWAAAKVVDEWKPAWKGPIGAVGQRNGVMGQDSLMTARKIRQPIVSHQDISGAFDGITYGKGAAVLWMFERAVGAEKFREGVRNYLRKHAWKTTNAADFLAAIAEVSDPVIPAAFRTFLDQAGVPMLTVGVTCDKGARPVVSLAQARYLPAGSTGSADQTWTMPVCLKYAAGKQVTERCEMLAEKTSRVELEGPCPTWVLANADAAGYYRTSYEGAWLGKLIDKGGKQLTVAERINIVGDLSALVSADEIGLGDALVQLPKLIKDDNHYAVSAAASIVGRIDDHVMPAKLRPNYARFVNKVFGAQARKLGWVGKPGEDEDARELRDVVVGLVADEGQDKKLIAQAQVLAKKWLDTREGIEPDLLGDVLSVAARHGDAALHERMFNLLKHTEDKSQRRALLGAIASFRGEALVKRNLEIFMTDKDLDMRESFALLGGGLQDPATRQLAYDFIKANHAAIMDKLPRMARGYIVMVTNAFCDQAHYDDAEAFFGPLVANEMSGPKLLAQSLEQMKLCMAFKQAQGAKIEAFLKKY